MRVYENNLKCTINQIDKKMFNLRKMISFGEKLIVKRLFTLFMIIYIEPVKKQIEFNRGTIHYVRPIMLSVGIIKSYKGETCMYGIALFDVISKVLFSGLVFVGVLISFNSFAAGLIVSSVVYMIVALVSLEDNRKTWQRFERFLNQQD